MNVVGISNPYISMVATDKPPLNHLKSILLSEELSGMQQEPNKELFSNETF